MGIKRIIDDNQAKFTGDGKYQRLVVIYQAFAGFLYNPRLLTSGLTHVRDSLDLKRIMILVVLAVLPALFMGLYNTGLQANQAMAEVGLHSVDSWRGNFIAVFAGYDADSVWHNLIHGLAYFLPIYLVTLVVGGFWEVLFAVIRKREINEGFLVTSLLFVLTLPATIPLWQVALGISFGVVIAKEVFGGTGRNFVNPALAGRAFLYFAYPAQISGDAVWTAVDGYTGATPLALVFTGSGGDAVTAASPAWGDAVNAASPLGQQAVFGVEAIEGAGISWLDAFLGFLPGAMGETSTLAILLGAAVLLVTRIASWRIMTGVFLGMMALTSLFNFIGSDSNPMYAMP
ncbi:MAG: NADH:ubiquinone reductase (Na(+)-transporting) subunit B, partial [Gammaproteobacteria bacterium]|nr:NADH:ubiquinone reductase (Na(+)-transporting) subunit B [Gammaproteobacteria bacterium]